MTLLEKLNRDLQQAMRNKDEAARDTLRMLKSDMTDQELKLGRPLEDGEVIAVLARAVKTRQDSVQQYEAGERKDLAERERAEIRIIEQYLPQSLTEEDAQAAVEKMATELGIVEKKDLGRLIKAVMEKYPGQVDGRLISKLAHNVLSKAH